MRLLLAHTHGIQIGVKMTVVTRQNGFAHLLLRTFGMPLTKPSVVYVVTEIRCARYPDHSWSAVLVLLHDADDEGRIRI